MATQPDTKLRRLPERGSEDFDLACAIIDEAKIGHVGIALEGQPYVLPMSLGRDGGDLLLHGSSVSRLLRSMAGGIPCCVTITHLDGLVAARSAFHSSMNYRSLMVFGRAVEVTNAKDKSQGLDRLVDHLLPGRSAEVRRSTRKELAATSLLRLPLETFSIKTRSGPPGDAAGDIDANVWAGVIPLRLEAGPPEDAPDLKPGLKPRADMAP
jgi:nitroimidazol reductase NimA-like FMN-containing flavoprotein (pyridoxamine 5'-phosphate oxidase superfamily)